MSAITTVEIEPDDDADIAIQCRLRASRAPAVYGPGDALSAELWPPTPPAYPWSPPVTAPLAAGLPVAWLLVDPTTGAQQDGYDQGQVVASLLAALVSTLIPTVCYALKIFRTPPSTGRRERIATILVKVRPNTAG